MRFPLSTQSNQIKCLETMSIDSFFNAMKKNMQGTIHLSDPPLYVGRMRVEILIVIENSVFENLVCMLTVVENCRKCET